jgi:hypothetical protein
MSKNIPGVCIDKWRQAPLDKTFKELLGMYTAYLNKVVVSYSKGL